MTNMKDILNRILSDIKRVDILPDYDGGTYWFDVEDCEVGDFFRYDDLKDLIEEILKENKD